MRYFYAVCIAIFANFSFAQDVKIADFGGLPNDNKCDILAFESALSHCKKVGAKRLILNSGVYEFHIENPEKQVAILIEDMPNFSIEGVSKNNVPQTILLRKYEFKPNLSGTQILSVRHCENFKLQGVAFDNFPQYMSAGKVVSSDENGVLIKVFKTLPFFDNTPIYCANAWNSKTRNLKVGAPSLTFGGPNVESNLSENTLQIVDKQKRLLKLPSREIATHLQKGDIISWNFGWRGCQVLFDRCPNLRVENVETYSAIGFCMQASHCENIYANGVRFIRKGEQMHVGSRDAWKLYCCRGNVKIQNCYFEGVRWDAQNVHGVFAWALKKTSKNKAIFGTHKDWRWGVLPTIAPVGSKVGLWLNKNNEVLLTVKSAKQTPRKKISKNKCIEIEFEEDLPSFIESVTLANFYGININSYELKNSTFRNIAGTASLIRNDNVKIRNCVFDHIMYPAICVGGAMHECEGVSCKNAIIEGNTFSNCAWQPRHNAIGAVSIALQYCKQTPTQLSPMIKNICVRNNKFKACEVAIDAVSVRNLIISNNGFEDVKTKLVQRNNLEVNSDIAQ